MDQCIVCYPTLLFFCTTPKFILPIIPWPKSWPFYYFIPQRAIVHEPLAKIIVHLHVYCHCLSKHIPYDILFLFQIPRVKNFEWYSHKQ